MSNAKKISEAVIRRLPRYHRMLTSLEKSGKERISSSELAKSLGLNASQIRQDFNCFGGFGQQGYGYHVGTLLAEIKKILGLDKRWNIIIIGAGNIGSALARYTGFLQEGYNVSAIFDIDENVVGNGINGIKILHLSSLSSFLDDNKIDIAAICAQKKDAQEICDMLVDCGVNGIWNYAPIDLVNENAIIENVHLSDYLNVLSFKLNNAN